MWSTSERRACEGGVQKLTATSVVIAIGSEVPQLPNVLIGEKRSVCSTSAFACRVPEKTLGDGAAPLPRSSSSCGIAERAEVAAV